MMIRCTLQTWQRHSEYRAYIAHLFRPHCALMIARNPDDSDPLFPASDILEESQAQDTIQNVFYSATILHAHNWSSAEIVSSPYHLGRTALILAAFNQRDPALHLDWRTHPSHWPPEYSLTQKLTL